MLQFIPLVKFSLPYLPEQNVDRKSWEDNFLITLSIKGNFSLVNGMYLTRNPATVLCDADSCFSLVLGTLLKGPDC